MAIIEQRARQIQHSRAFLGDVTYFRPRAAQFIRGSARVH